MSNLTSLIGTIRTPRTWEGSVERNRRAVEHLPDIDEWPALVRGMFAVTPENVSYIYRTVFFAAEIKSLDEAWARWLEKFEDLLRTMEWTVVTVYLETEHHGDYRFNWWANEVNEGTPATVWEFDGGPRSFG